MRKLIVTSRVAAYGTHADNDRPLTEDSPTRGNQNYSYSRAKAAMEKYLDEYSRIHPEMVVTRLRPSIVLGPATDSQRYPFYREKYFFVPRGREEPVRFVHEDDVACALNLTIKQDAPGAYNVASQMPVLQSDLKREIGGRVICLSWILWKVLAFLVYLQWRRGKIATPPALMNATSNGCICMSTEKIEKELGWRPRYDSRQAFMATFSKNDQANG